MHSKIWYDRHAGTLYNAEFPFWFVVVQFVFCKNFVEYTVLLFTFRSSSRNKIGSDFLVTYCLMLYMFFTLWPFASISAVRSAIQLE